MVTVTQLPSGQLGIRSSYYYKDRIRKIPTARFDGQTKQWTIEKCMFGYLESVFYGKENGLELVYKTPRWVILGEPVPDMSAMYKIDNNIELPELKLDMYNYQKFGARFIIDKMLKHNFAICADDVGLGKTIEAIATIKWFIENKGVKKVLVVAKKSIKQQWCNEINKFTDLNTDFFIDYTKGTKAQRTKTYKAFDKADKGILVVNHHTFLNDTSIIDQLGFGLFIIDEVHEVKARNGVINNNLMSVICGKAPVLFLTGTPIMSRPEDIFGIIQIASPDYFGLWSDFRKRYLIIQNGRFGYTTIGAKHLDELRDKVQDILIRRTEFEVQLELPTVRQQTVYCSMDDTQEDMLVDIRDKELDIMSQVEKLKKQYDATKEEGLRVQMEKLMAFSKGYIAAKQAVCTDPRLFSISNSKMFREMYDQFVPGDYKMSSKIENILDILEDIINSNNKVILFSKFRTTISLVANEITKKLKVPILTYTGFENEEARANAINLFWNTDTHNIILGTEALSAGVNMQVAGYIINIDQADTAAIRTQRIGRARRVGSQFKSVMVYDMITSDGLQAKSKDIERLENIRKNMDLTDALVNIDEAQRNALIKAMEEE